MQQEVSVLLIGIKGYGQLFLEELLDKDLPASIAGLVDSRPHLSPHYDRLVKMGVPMYKSIEEFFASHTADLTIISTPIHVHTKQTITALEHGSNVLCEKPICTTEEDARRIIKARDKSGRFVAIGFNWSFSTPVQQLKKDMMNGLFGTPKRLKSLILWPRPHEYYNRSPWAGEVFSAEGDYILDSVANNATSHFLHNMLYVLGAEEDKSAEIKELTSELYRANDIKTFDTCAARIETSAGTGLYFYASHAVEEEEGPVFEFECEKATIYYSAEKADEGIRAVFHDGIVKSYGDPEAEHMKKVEVAVKAVADGHQNILCGPEASLAQMRSIHAMHASTPDVQTFSQVKTAGEPTLTSVPGLEEELRACYSRCELPSDREATWSKKGKAVPVPVDEKEWKEAVAKAKKQEGRFS
ncbi:Gfo/Idh/MocA family protein [Salsuginibacillus kocurii]|uniref:Gfo/Idh/MocA family protein n=1 Tax=Salsuginibacillus kocurii TaxID=427078 RepID=UPI000366718B|nr:Gfo/Idh/MocA family oxidoreductase [Salsuginibacillus kocurii]